MAQIRKIVIVGWIGEYHLWKLDRGYQPLTDDFVRFNQNHCKNPGQRVIMPDQIFEQEQPGTVKVRITIEVKQ